MLRHFRLFPTRTNGASSVISSAAVSTCLRICSSSTFSASAKSPAHPAATPAAAGAAAASAATAVDSSSQKKDIQASATTNSVVPPPPPAKQQSEGELLRQEADRRRSIERQKREDMSGSVELKRNTKVADDRLTAPVREKVSKITVTSSHVVQQSGSWQTRGDVIGTSEAGVPIVHRDADVAIPELYCIPTDLTETYFELPAGWDQHRFYAEVARENLPMITLWGIGLLGYWYSWPSLIGWPALLAGTAATQRIASRFGSSLPQTQLFCNDALKGRIVVITGASSGIGLQTAVDLALRGADVICSTRRPVNEFWKVWDAAMPRGMDATEREAVARRVSVSTLDLMELSSVRGFADFVKDRLALHCQSYARLPKRELSAVKNKKPTQGGGAVANDSSAPQEDTFVRAPPLDILINNAALISPEIKMSSIGFESHIAANVLGPMYLTELLLPNVRTAAHIDTFNNKAAATTSSSSAATAAAADDEAEKKSRTLSDEDKKKYPTQGGFGRVVNVTSMAHVSVRHPTLVQRELIPKNFDKTTFNFGNRYAVSKLLNIYYTDHLARRGVRAVSAAPGGVATSIFRNQAPSIGVGGWAHHLSQLLLRSPREGANTVIFAALCQDEHFVSGGFYANCSLRKHAKSWMAVNDRERNEFLDWAKGQLPLKSLDE